MKTFEGNISIPRNNGVDLSAYDCKIVSIHLAGLKYKVKSLNDPDNTYIGIVGEFTVNRADGILRFHDGQKPGGAILETDDNREPVYYRDVKLTD